MDSWSRDYIAYTRGNQKESPSWDIWALPLSGDRKPFPVLKGTSNEEEPSISPNGKWMAYVSDERGNWEVYISSFPKGDGKWLVSAGGGRQPRWGVDGKEVFYMATDNKLMAVETHEKGSSIEIGKRQELFQSNAVSTGFRNYDVTADGKKFVVITRSPSKDAALHLIVNWQDLLPNSRQK